MMDIPIRLSVDDLRGNEAGWDLARRLDVHLDGQLQTKVVEYDTEAGTVTRIVVDEAGEIVIDREAEAVKLETITGEVTVTLSDRM